MTRVPKQARSKATVDAIIDAGFLCIARHGTAGMTTGQIAEVAGVGIGSLYEYFADRDAVLAAMQDRVCDDLVVMVRRVTPEVLPLEPAAAMKYLLREFREFITLNDGLYLSYIRSALSLDLKLHLEPVNKILMEFALQYLMRHPQLMRVRNIPATMYVLINSALFLIARHLSDPHPPISYEDLSQTLTDIVVNHLNQEVAAATPAA